MSNYSHSSSSSGAAAAGLGPELSCRSVLKEPPYEKDVKTQEANESNKQVNAQGCNQSTLIIINSELVFYYYLLTELDKLKSNG